MTGEQKYGMITISVYAYLSGVEKGAQNMKRRFLTPVLGGLLLLALAVIVVQQCTSKRGCRKAVWPVPTVPVSR